MLAKFLFSSIPLIVILIPVSYTHLDVYKRQSEYRDTLEEDESLSDSVIEAKCEEFRKKLAVQVQRQVKDEKLRNAYVSRAKRGATDASSDAENSSNSHSSEGK